MAHCAPFLVERLSARGLGIGVNAVVRRAGLLGMRRGESDPSVAQAAAAKPRIVLGSIGI